MVGAGWAQLHIDATAKPETTSERPVIAVSPVADTNGRYITAIRENAPGSGNGYRLQFVAFLKVENPSKNKTARVRKEGLRVGGILHRATVRQNHETTQKASDHDEFVLVPKGSETLSIPLVLDEFYESSIADESEDLVRDNLVRIDADIVLSFFFDDEPEGKRLFSGTYSFETNRVKPVESSFQ